MGNRLEPVEEDLQPLNSPETSMPSGHDPQVCDPLMDEDDVAEDQYRKGYQDAARKAIDHWRCTLRAMLIFKGNALLAIQCAAVAHGFLDLVSKKDQVALADHFRCERANVAKLVKMIQKRLELPPALGQRGSDGCENMSATRKSQLQHVKD
jgi:hypothetical protein